MGEFIHKASSYGLRYCFPGPCVEESQCPGWHYWKLVKFQKVDLVECPEVIRGMPLEELRGFSCFLSLTPGSGFNCFSLVYIARLCFLFQKAKRNESTPS